MLVEVPRPRLPRFVPQILGVAVACGSYLGLAPEADAAVRSRGGGIEIEGAQDRRGFYIGGGLGFGGTFFYVDDFVPASRIELNFGGGVTKRFLLGASLHATPYFRRGAGAAFGGDIEATGFLWRGFYVRGGVGLGGVPKRSIAGSADDSGTTVGLGGKAGGGYEFFLNKTAAMDVGFTYDARFVPADRLPRQTALMGLRFTWY